MELQGRNKTEDLLTVANMIASSLYLETDDPYEGYYTQNNKRPFGNSGGAWFDVWEKLGLKGCERDKAEAYAKELWEDGGKMLAAFVKAARDAAHAGEWEFNPTVKVSEK